MSRKTIDCRAVPNEVGCTLALSGEPGELLDAAVVHAVTVHGHADSPELREALSGLIADEPAVSAPGAFVQLIEFSTDRADEWDAIIERWSSGIGASRTVRWSVLAADRDRPGHYAAIVEFPGYAQAMENSGHPATDGFLKELTAICDGEPEFRNLDTRSVQAY